MKQIETIKIWKNGQSQEATISFISKLQKKKLNL